jgi:predicted DNA-binding transcriptional regulator YafY
MPLDAVDRAGTKWDRVARYLKVASILHGRPDGVRVAELANLVGVAKRTIYRDLEALERDAGLPVWENKGRYGLEMRAFLPPLALTLHEAMTLFLAARILAKTNDEHDTELIGAFVKLAEVLPPVLGQHIHDTVDVIAETPEVPTFTRVLRTLTEAWAKQRVVAIEYEADAYDPERPPRQTRVRPYAIEPSALTHALYLIGLDEERGAQRTFKIERIRSASLTPDSFEPEERPSPASRLRGAWDIISDQPVRAVTVRFSPDVARRVAETRWHASQSLDPQDDGSLLWRGRIAGLHEVLVWILGWGADAEVLEPPELRAMAADQLRRAAGQYGDSP